MWYTETASILTGETPGLQNLRSSMLVVYKLFSKKIADPKVYAPCIFNNIAFNSPRESYHFKENIINNKMYFKKKTRQTGWQACQCWGAGWTLHLGLLPEPGKARQGPQHSWLQAERWQLGALKGMPGLRQGTSVHRTAWGELAWESSQSCTVERLAVRKGQVAQDTVPPRGGKPRGS